MLEKMGWSKGQGLGKEKHGMKEAIEVKKKEDTLGVGLQGLCGAAQTWMGSGHASDGSTSTAVGRWCGIKAVVCC
jgi:hypothetical protein